MNKVSDFLLNSKLWIPSLMSGLNIYQVKENKANLLKSDALDEFDYSDLGEKNYEFQLVNREKDKNSFSLLLQKISNRAAIRIRTQIEEKIYKYFLGNKNFVFPIDLVEVGDNNAIIFPTIDYNNYDSINSYLHQKSPDWDIIKSLFQRIDFMQYFGFGIGGFSREQVLVNKISKEVVFVGLDRITSIHEKIEYGYGYSFFDIPISIIENFKRNNLAISKVVLDIFSAACMAFYMIFYTHPFVGSYFWYNGEIVRNDYFSRYMRKPEYIFDDEHSSTNDNLIKKFNAFELNKDISDRWEKIDAELKSLFDNLFLALLYPKSTGLQATEDFLIANTWIRAIDRASRLYEDEANVDLGLYRLRLV